MNNFISSKTVIGSLSFAILITTLAIAVFVPLPGEDISIVSAQLVDVDEPPTNATEELDVKIDATEPLPVNGTIIVDITDADDIDIDAIPPQGVSIVVTNTTLTVTNNPVEFSEEEANETPPADAEGFGTGSPVNNNENEVEESSDNSGGDDGGDNDSANDDTPDEEDDEEE